MTISYNNILLTANKFALGATEGKAVCITHYLHDFFKESREINPSVARMLLQKGMMDAADTIMDQYMSDKINVFEFTEKNKILSKLNGLISSDPEFKELENRIKNMYKKTGNKRLAIAPYILDSLDILSPVKKRKDDENYGIVYNFAYYLIRRMNPAIMQSPDNKVIEDKLSKKINYFKRIFHLI